MQPRRTTIGCANCDRRLFLSSSDREWDWGGRGKSTVGFSRKSRERYHERQETETAIAAQWKSFSSVLKKLHPHAPEPFVVSPATTPTASQTPETVEAPLLTPTPPSPEVPAAASISVQAPEQEGTVVFTVDMSESLHRKLSMLAAKTGRKKADSWCGCCCKTG